MAAVPGVTRRLRDTVRDSKIRKDIPSKLHWNFDSIDSEIDRGFGVVRHHRKESTCRVERVFPRQPPAWDCEGEQEFQRHIDILSSNKEVESWFHDYMKREAPSLGVYRRNTESESIIVRFKRNLLSFDGFWHSDDLLRWIVDIEDFFAEVRPPKHLKCNIVWSKMKGRAFYWWKHVQQVRIDHGKEEIVSWSLMKKLLISRFAPNKCSMKLPKDEKGKEDNILVEVEGSVQDQSEVLFVADNNLKGRIKYGSLTEVCVIEHSKEVAEVETTKWLTKTLTESYIDKQKQVENLDPKDESGDLGSSFSIDACKTTPCKSMPHCALKPDIVIDSKGIGNVKEEVVEYSMVDSSAHIPFSTKIPNEWNLQVSEEKGKKLVGDGCHTTEISRTEVSDKDNEYSKERNEGAKTIDHGTGPTSYLFDPGGNIDPARTQVSDFPLLISVGFLSYRMAQYMQWKSDHESVKPKLEYKVTSENGRQLLNDVSVLLKYALNTRNFKLHSFDPVMKMLVLILAFENIPSPCAAIPVFRVVAMCVDAYFTPFMKVYVCEVQRLTGTLNFGDRIGSQIHMGVAAEFNYMLLDQYKAMITKLLINLVVKLSWNSSSMCIHFRESVVFTGVVLDIGLYASNSGGMLVSERQRLTQTNVDPQLDNFSYPIHDLNFAKEMYILIIRRYYNYSYLSLFGVLLVCTVSRITAAIELLSIRSCSYLDLLISLRDQLDKRKVLYWYSCQPDSMVHFMKGVEEEVGYCSITESKTYLFDPSGIFYPFYHVASSVRLVHKFRVTFLLDSRVGPDGITIAISMVAINEHFYTFIVCFERSVNLWHKESLKTINAVVHVSLTTPYACFMLDLQCAMYMGTLRYGSVSRIDPSINGFSTMYLSLVFVRITSLDMATELRAVYLNGFSLEQSVRNHSVFLWTKVSTTYDNFSLDKWTEMLRTLNPAGVAQLCNLGMLCGMLMFHNRASLLLLNLELRSIVITNFDPGGIVFSYKTWKHASSSFLDVSTPNRTSGTSFENIFIPSIILHSQEDYIVNSLSMWFTPNGSKIRICVGKVKKTELPEMVKLQQQKYIGTAGHDLNWDFQWDLTMILGSLSVQMTSCICLGGIFLHMLRGGLILGQFQRQTRGRFIPRRGWNAEDNSDMEGKLASITMKLNGATAFSCRSIWCVNGPLRESLKLFHNVVTGLDPPLDLDEGLLWVLTGSLEDELSFRSGDRDDVICYRGYFCLLLCFYGGSI